MMRHEIYSGSFIMGKDEKLELYRLAKELIEQYGTHDHVVELRQLSCMGGVSLVVTKKRELDRDYIGYRGFMDYARLCHGIEEIILRRDQH